MECIGRPDEAFEARVCVWQPGSLECPGDIFTDRFIRHAAVDDSRACATCTCGDPTGDCEGDVVLYASNDCSGVPSLVEQIGSTCTVSAGGSVSSARGNSLSVSNVSCEPSVGTAVGEAEPDDPYTLCCMTVE
jgi:hypothetical protein